MNIVSPYCVLTDSRMRASDTDLPVLKVFSYQQINQFYSQFRSIQVSCTGKSVSEALILEPVNPQCDERLFIEFLEKYKFRTFCVQKLFLFVFVLTFKQHLYTTCSKLVFFGEFNEQSLVILWVNWCKNEGSWKRFTCMWCFFLFQFLPLLATHRGVKIPRNFC